MGNSWCPWTLPFGVPHLPSLQAKKAVEIIGSSTTEWRISMCAPPLAHASLDWWLQNAYKSTRRGRGRVKLRALACGRALANPAPSQTRGTRRCASVALRKLQVLACLGDVRAYAAHNAVQGETTMPFYEKGDVRIHYEEVGSGFPLLVIPGGGLNSTVAGLATHPFNPFDEFQDEFRVIAADLRNAKGGQSTGPLEVDRPWDAYTDDQLGLMDHLGIQEFMVLGFCIGGPFIWNLLQRAGDRVVAAVPTQPSGYRPEMPRCRDASPRLHGRHALNAAR